jgi:Tol biopolymer transport system component
MRRTRSLALLLAATLAAAGCDSTEPDEDELAEPLVVSDPVQQPVPAPAGGAAISTSLARNDMEDINAFVSLAPGSYPDAIVAEVVNRRLARSVPAPILDGGFDPVAIPAAAGDTVIVNIMRPGGQLVSIRGRVPARRPPRVVRTYPRPGRTDIAFNAIIAAVFSEPVDSASIDQTSIRLSELPGPSVEGTVRLTPGALGVEFVPLRPLLPGTEYRLVVMRTIRDLSGDPLEVQASLDFTTEGPSPGNLVVVRSVTSGADLDPDGYRVVVNGALGPQLAANGSVSIPDLAAGTHTVELQGLSGNCLFDGSPVQEVALGTSDTLDVDFAITCQSVGSIVVTTTTSGSDPDTDGYEVLVEPGEGQAIGTSEALTLSVPTGRRTVILTGVKGNCSAVGSLRQEVTVQAGQAATAAFHVTCDPDFRPSGAIAFAAAAAVGAQSAIWVANADGSDRIRITDGRSYDTHPTWSPDGTCLAFTRLSEGGSDIYVVNTDGSNLQRRTVTGQAYTPAWSPDGTKIVYTDENGFVYLSEADGDWTVPQYVGFADEWSGHPAWSPDGTTIAFIRGSFSFASSIYLMDADGSNPRPLTAESPETQYLMPRWSRDGQNIAAVAAYLSADGTVQAYSLAIVRADGAGITSIATSGRADWPSWSRDEDLIAVRVADCGGCDGRIVYIRPDGRGSSATIDGASDPAWKP